MARNRRKLQAVLAAGLVLGVGAVITLAAWNDSEFVSGEFKAGTFNLEGKLPADANYTEHASIGDAAVLAFTTPVNNLSPGDVVYAGYLVRLGQGTTTDAALTLSDVTASGSAVPNLSYAVYQLTDATDTCDAATVTGLTAFATQTTLADPVAPGNVALAKGTSGSLPGAAEQLCIVVTATGGLEQAQDASATWQFTATSTS